MNTIQGRLLVMLLLGLGVVMAAGGAAVYWIAKISLIRQLDAGLEQRAHALTSLVSIEPQGLVFDADDLWSLPLEDAQFEFRMRSGVVLKRGGRHLASELPAREVREGELRFENVQIASAEGDIHARATWMTFRPKIDAEADEADETDEDEEVLAPPDAAPDRLIVAVAVDRRSVDGALATLLRAVLVVGGLLALTVGVVVTVGVRWGLGPLDRLGRQLGGVSETTISRRVTDRGAPRELAPVYRELNRMLDRMESALERERSFADAAAHELRTPLAELRAAAETAMRWPDAEQAGHTLDEVLSIGREMERLIESLLLISRANAGSMHVAIGSAGVATIVRQCLDRAREAVREKRLRLSIEVADQATLSAAAPALEIVVRNLIDNAVQYTPAGGTITIKTPSDEHGRSRLIVENGPVDLSADDLSRMFDPFWRSDSARSDRTHIGLGLTVAQRIAQASGLQIDAELVERRLRITIAPGT